MKHVTKMYGTPNIKPFNTFTVSPRIEIREDCINGHQIRLINVLVVIRLSCSALRGGI
jgi:hypothetical protein